MSVKLSAVRRHTETVELIMVTIYVVVTAYLIACSAPPRIAFALRDAAMPFQLIVRARNAGAERSLLAWRSSQFEIRTLMLSR